MKVGNTKGEAMFAEFPWLKDHMSVEWANLVRIARIDQGLMQLRRDWGTPTWIDRWFSGYDKEDVKLLDQNGVVLARAGHRMQNGVLAPVSLGWTGSPESVEECLAAMHPENRMQVKFILLVDYYRGDITLYKLPKGASSIDNWLAQLIEAEAVKIKAAVAQIDGETTTSATNE